MACSILFCTVIDAHYVIFEWMDTDYVYLLNSGGWMNTYKDLKTVSATTYLKKWIITKWAKI